MSWGKISDDGGDGEKRDRKKRGGEKGGIKTAFGMRSQNCSFGIIREENS
jgi:hypothetical protein